MLSFEEAQKIILDNIQVLDIEEKEAFRCSGQVLAEDIQAEIDLPSRDSATQDGYAVQYQDVHAAGIDHPVELDILETVRAGSLAVNPVQPGTAIRIMTGSVLPEGADCVIRFEDTDEPVDKNGPNPDNPQKVQVFKAGFPGCNIRKAGTHIARGVTVVPKGTVIGPNQISVLMYIGRGSIKVIRRPNIAIISTGDELISPGRPLSPEKTYNCNSAAIGAMINHYGGLSQILGIARDYETSILAKIRKSTESDLIISSGGVSRGDYDLVRKVLEKIGVLKLTRINMGPGASFTFGMVDKLVKNKQIPFFALSGPPSGCMINCETLVKPAILKMKGYTNLEHPVVEAQSEDDLDLSRPMALVKWTYLKNIQGDYRVRLQEIEDNGDLISIARANSLTIIPRGTRVKKGDSVKVYPLDWCHEYKPCL